MYDDGSGWALGKLTGEAGQPGEAEAASLGYFPKDYTVSVEEYEEGPQFGKVW